MSTKLTKAEILQRQRTKTGILTQEEVARIKWSLQNGYTKRELARIYSVSLWTIRAIARGDTWHWVDPDDGPAGQEYHSMPVLDPMTAQEADESRKRLERLLAGEDPQFLTDGSKFGARPQSDLDSLKQETHDDDQASD